MAYDDVLLPTDVLKVLADVVRGLSGFNK